jgi:hypothetical protein
VKATVFGTFVIFIVIQTAIVIDLSRSLNETRGELSRLLDSVDHVPGCAPLRLVQDAPPARAPCEPQLFVGPGTAVHVTLSNVDRAYIVERLAFYLGRGQAKPTKDLYDVLNRASSVAMTLQTNCRERKQP